MAKVNIGHTGKTLFKEVGDDDVGGLAAELAYHFLLALFPFFIFLAALGGFLAGLVGMQDPTQAILEQFGQNLPQGAGTLIAEQLRSVIESRSAGLLSFGAIGALWAATAGMKSVIKAMNRAYDVPESRGFIKQSALALGLTLLASVFVVAAFALLVIGQVFAQQISEMLGLPAFVLTVVRLVLAAGLILLASAFLYWAAPNIDLELKWVTPGSLLFTIGWLVATGLFAFYVANFGNYNATYGTLGGVVILLLWFFITGYILVLGAELNAIVDEQVDPEAIQEGRRRKQDEAIRSGKAPPRREDEDSTTARERAPVVTHTREVSREPAEESGRTQTVVVRAETADEHGDRAA